MTVDEILKLIDAGFTRDEIKAMEHPAPAPEMPAPAEESPAPEAAAAAPAQAEAPETSSSADAFMQMFDERMKQMTDIVNRAAKVAGMPSIDEGIKPKGIDDIVSDFFKED